MNATVTKAASRSSHGANGQMAYAIARASKQHAETMEKVESLAKDIMNTAQQTPKKLYRAEQLAEELGLSASWVYQQISKDKPEVVAQNGRVHFYSENYLESLRQRGARPRARRVQVIRKVLAKPGALNQEIEEVAAEVSQPEPLMSRLERMEQETKNIQAMLENISRFLGIGPNV